MEQVAHLWLFFVMVFGVVLLPGLDMAFVLANSLVGGRRAGLAATAGIVTGGVCHVVMAVLGIMTVLQLVPAAFNAVLLAGAAYIAWIGSALLRSQAAFGGIPSQDSHGLTKTFRRGMLTNLLNPKAYLFMLAIFPQFMRPEYGPMWIQGLVLWAIIALTQAGVYSSMALAGDRMRNWLLTRPAVNVRLARAVGALLIAMALWTGYEGWQRL